METIWQDIKFAVRMLAKSPGFAVAAVLTLALGIGATTAIFSVVNAILLRPLEYQRPDQLVIVWEKNLKKGWIVAPASYPNFVDLKSGNNVLADLAAFGDSTFNLTGGDEPERLPGWRVSTGLFSMLGVNPLQGRTFLPEDSRPGNSRVLVISYGLWQRRFGGRSSLVGQTVALNGEPYTVVGIMPRNFKFPPTFAATVASSQVAITNADLWVPLADDTPPVRETRTLFMIGRLKQGVTHAQAQSDLNVIARRLEQEYPAANTGMEVSVVPLHTQVSGDVRLALLNLFAAVGLVLLIACVNVANLLLARAAGRQKEIAIRGALGCTRARLVRQLLTESALLGLMGGILGLLLAFGGVYLLVALSPGNLPHLKDVTIDGSVLLFALLISLLTALVFGLAPALHASKPDLQETLKEGGRSSTGGSRANRLRSALVISEIASALVLLIASGLMLKSFWRLQHVNPGFEAENLLTLELQLPGNKYGEAPQQLGFQQQLLQRVKSVPGVSYAATVNNLPFSGNEAYLAFAIEGRPAPNPADRPRAYHRVISSDYMQAMGIAFQRGRPFNDHDNADAPGVTIINEAAARRYWPGEDPLGKRLKRGRLESQNPWLTIVGIIGPISHTSLEVEAQPEFYQPFLQSPDGALTLVARSAADPRTITNAVRGELLALDRDLPASNIKFMTELISKSVAQPRLYAVLLIIFAIVALILAAVGIYGLLSYSVTQRKQDIGIRLALGATPGNIYKLVLVQALRLVIVGLIIGLVLSLISTRLMASLLFGVSTTDPLIFILISLLLFFVALLASYFPARSATRIDPLTALRYE
jgi:putative ABC transport system permease protein